MNKWKRLATMFVAFMMVFGLVMPVSAASNNNPHTISISNDKAGHTYEAYQVFAGRLSNGKLVDIVWGKGVESEALLNDLKTIAAFKDCQEANDVAKVLEEKSGEASFVENFANVVSKHLSSTKFTSAEATKVENKYVSTIDVTGDGYYFIKDKDKSVGNHDAYTKYILKVIKDVKVNAKSDVPTIDKVIVENGTDVKFNNGSVGDKVNYKLTSTVPNMAGYNRYYFVVKDTLSEGLSFNNDIQIKIGNTTLSSDAFEVTTNGNKIEIVIKNFIQYTQGEEIIITYSATINEKAVIGVEGNPNTADLTYSNNPNFNYNGDKPTDESDVPVGKTPESTTYTYVTKIVLTKVDGKDTSKKLSGAIFEITGEKVNKVKVTKESFEIDNDNGTYYLLKDKTYTTTVPTDETASLYENTTDKYVLTYKEEWVTTTETVKAQGVVKEDGTLEFVGLGAGEYEITEMRAPEGYNLLSKPIQVTISWTQPESGTNCTWTVTGGDALVKDGYITLMVANYTGSTLPETGGMGTTVLYVVGSLLVVGAAILLVSKKRMNHK